jgi:hypothetical protein
MAKATSVSVASNRHYYDHDDHCRQRMHRREEQHVHDLMNTPTVSRHAAHRVADGVASVIKERAALQTREQIFGHSVNYAPSRERPCPCQSDVEHAMEREETETGDDDCEQQSRARWLERKRRK